MLQSGIARDGGVIQIGLNYPVSESSVYLLFSTQETDMRNTKPIRMSPHKENEHRHSKESTSLRGEFVCFG